MYKLLIHIILYVLLYYRGFAQKEDLVWPLGDRAGVNFSTGPAIPMSDPDQMFLHITNVAISDTSGNLLFYSNGIAIANKLHDTLQNGNNLSPGTFTPFYRTNGMPISQGALVIPFPREKSKYYLFHLNLEYMVPGSYISGQLYYSLIDMSLDGGLGGVTSEKNMIILEDSIIQGRLTATKHGNGRDWWLLAHRYESNRFFKFLITPEGVDGPFLQEIGSVMEWQDDWSGQTTFSPDGAKLANVLRTGKVDVFDFDRCTGELSNCVTLNDSDLVWVFGCSFSPNNELLYLSTLYKLYQYDMKASEIDTTKRLIAVWDSSYAPTPTIFALHQLAPDGKIYMSTYHGTTNLHVINDPNKRGIACDFVQNDFYFGAKHWNGIGLPNNPNYRLGKLPASSCDTLTDIPEIPKPEKINIPNFLSSNNGDKTFVIRNLPENTRLQIFNFMGQQLYFSDNYDNSWDISNIATGIYFYSLRTREDELINGKLVMIK